MAQVEKTVTAPKLAPKPETSNLKVSDTLRHLAVYFLQPKDPKQTKSKQAGIEADSDDSLREGPGGANTCRL